MQLKAEMSGPAKKLASTTGSSSVTRRPDNGTLFKLPTGTLALLATIGFLSVIIIFRKKETNLLFLVLSV